MNPIGPPGTVQAPQQVLPNHPNAHAILADAANRRVLVPTLGNDRVNQFTFDAATGRLAPGTPPAVEVKAKAGPRHFVFHPSGKLVYVIGELDGADLRLRLRRRHRDSSRRSRRSARCRPTSRASPRPPICTSRPTASSSTDRSAPRAPWPRSRSIPANGTLTLDRQRADREATARLQHRFLRSLSARGRPALPRPVELRDRPGQRQAHQAEGVPHGQEPELGRDRRSSVTRTRRSRARRRPRRCRTLCGVRPSGQHGAPTVDAIGHIGRDLKLHGGVDAVSATSTPSGIGNNLGHRKLPAGPDAQPRWSSSTWPGSVAAGRPEPLAPGFEITGAACSRRHGKAHGVEVRPGDSLLIRTGWGQYFAQGQREVPRRAVARAGARRCPLDHRPRRAAGRRRHRHLRKAAGRLRQGALQRPHDAALGQRAGPGGAGPAWGPATAGRGQPRPARMASRTWAGCLAASATLAQCFRTVPSGPTHTVDRMTPLVFLPYIILSP